MNDTPTQPDREDFVRQRHALAGFGRLALHTDDLDEVLQRACELVSHGCGGSKAKVLEYLPAENALLVVAGVGWREGFVGETKLSADTGSPAGYALKTGEPVLTPDVKTEQRFRIPQALLDHDVCCLVNVLIETPGGKPYGVLEIDSVETREFDQDDVDFLRTYSHLLGGAIDRYRRNRQLTAAVAEKDLLMRELQHRVKNDLQMVTSLISLQQRRARPECRSALSSVRDRIEALRQLNATLYQGDRFDQLELGGYLKQLAQNLLDLDDSGAVRLNLHVEHLDVGPRVAVPLGLITNEFITNSVKYAFDGAPGAVSIRLTPLADGERWRLELADSGKGLPDQSATSGTGLQLIALFAKQLGAEIEWRSEGGVRLTVDFPLKQGDADPASKHG